MKHSLRIFFILSLAISGASVVAQYNEVWGYVRFDANGNGIYETSDPPMDGVGVRKGPLGLIRGTDINGMFYFYDTDLSAHVDTISMPGLPPGSTVTPANYVLNVPSGGGFLDSTLFFLVQLPPGTIDASGEFLYPQPYAVPGTSSFFGLHVVNTGNTVADIDVQFSGAPQFAWYGCNVPPLTQTGMDATWTFPAMTPMQQLYIFIYATTDPLVPLGTQLVSSMSVSTAGDGDPTNNQDALTDTVVASVDPNFKVAHPEKITAAQGLQGTQVDYVIDFQNTGTATASSVVITDTLDARIADGAISMVASSHICDWTRQGNVLRIAYPSIQLPDSAADQVGSHGYVQFRAHTAAGLLPGTTIPNIANIYFDLNPPVITDTCWLAVALQTGIAEQAPQSFSVYPNPTTGPITVQLDGSAPVSRIVLLDALGHRVADVAVRAGSSSIQLDALAKGIYFLQAFDGSQRIVGTNKVIKE